jgi:hypothetical protein
MKIRVKPLLPAYHLTDQEVKNVLTGLPTNFDQPTIVVNDESDEINSAFSFFRDQIDLVIIPFQVGKAEAIRRGLLRILEDTEVEFIVQFDGRSKQPVAQLSKMVDFITEHNLDLLIGDRYSKQDLTDQPHRQQSINLITQIVKQITGYSLSDIVCGTRVYNRSAAHIFSNIRSFGYGIEAEQIVLAALHRLKVMNFPLQSSSQVDRTNAEKIEDTFQTFICYADALNISSNVRAALCRAMVLLKKRRDFSIDLADFGGTGIVRLIYQGGEIVDSYSSQNTLDAYQLKVGI